MTDPTSEPRDLLQALSDSIRDARKDRKDRDASPQPDTAPEGPWTVHRNFVLRDDGAEVIVHAEPGTDDVDDEVLAVRVAAALNGAAASEFVDVVFDGPPSHESGRFVEAEGPDGRSVNAGEWINRGNGLWALRIPLNGAAATPAEWPVWLTPEHTDIHTAIENAMKQALAHCYGSADASGYAWTMEGLFSVAANSIMDMLRDAGCPPPAVGDVEAIPMPEDTWLADEDEPDEELPATPAERAVTGDLPGDTGNQP